MRADPLSRRLRLLLPVLAAVVAALLVSGGVRAQTAPGLPAALQNPGFEQTAASGAAPAGWFVPPPVQAGGYKFAVSDKGAKEGGRCAVLSLDKPPAAGAFGNAMQVIDATKLRGKRVRVRAALRFAPNAASTPASGALLWVRVDGADASKPGFYGNSADQPAGGEWRYVEVVGDIAPDARALNVGLLLLGAGAASIDDVTLSVTDIPAGEAPEGPRPLTPRGKENVVAFAWLYGYVRHFYPSDALSPVEWDRLAIRGMRAAEKATNGDALAKALTALFAPVAPQVQVFPAADPAPALPASLTAVPAKDPKVVAWKHVGYGGGTIRSIYESTLTREPAPGGKLPPGFADPRKPFEADLGGGVRCRVPLALWDGTAPTPPPADPAPKATADDRATRLAAVVVVWNVFEHFYPYFDVVKVDWPAVLSETLTAAATDPDQPAFDKTMRRLVAKAQDGHGRVGLPSQAPFADAPVRVGWVENSLAVVAVAGQGAEGVKPGDVVVSVGGKPAAQALADAEELISGATPQWRRFRSTSELFWGPKDSVVTLGLRPDAGTGAARTVTLRRTLPAFGEGALPVGPVRPAKIAEPRPGVLYVDLDRVSDAELKETLPKLAAAKGVVFDMRGYPRVGAGFLGNLSDKPVTSARWGVPTVAAPDHAKINFEEGRWPPMGPTEPRIKGKVVFLTDGRAISYAESVMGIVENYKLGEIVGEPTAGTNGNINGVAAPGGYTVIFTGMRVLKHDGSRHHGVGIAPTVPQPLTLRGLAAGRDDQLERALSLATGGS